MRTTLILISLFLSLFLSPLQAEGQSLNQVVIDPKINMEVLIGTIDRSGLKLPVFESFFTTEYMQYEPDSAFVEKIKQIPFDWNVVIVLGTWCSDSQREVPRFFRIMDASGITDSMVKMYGVGRDKLAGDVDISTLEITLVPTFVFYRNGKEIGRIIESPLSTLEKDMLVLLAQPPKPLSPGSVTE